MADVTDNKNIQRRRLEKYRDGEFQRIDGYGARDILNVLLPLVGAYHDAMSITGDVGEIGVHHGRFFLALDSVRREGERAIAADVFDWQEMNIDGSGNGNRSIFENNINRVSHDASSIDIYQGDSLDLKFRRWLAEKNYHFRLCSIDGGHTVQHTVNDLETVEMYLVEGGVVLLDDFMNPGFPGVTEGVYRYLQAGNKLSPVWTVASKLVFISVSHADRFRAYISKYCETRLGRRVRKTLVDGHQVLWLVPKKAVAV